MIAAHEVLPRVRVPAAAALVGALAAWSATEALWVWSSPPWPDGPVALGVAWAVAIALPLLFARRAPLAAALAVVALVILRDLAGYRVPGSAAHSVILLVALFAAEATAGARGVPWRGSLAGGALLAGWVGMDVYDAGTLANASLAAYAHVSALIFGGVGAGVALRDRRGEAERWERSVHALEARAGERVDLAVTSERARIAAEVEAVVGVLLGGVRPLARRAAAAVPDQLAADMHAVQRRAQDALLEMRRALQLLHDPLAPPPAAPASPPGANGAASPPAAAAWPPVADGAASPPVAAPASPRSSVDFHNPRLCNSTLVAPPASAALAGTIPAQRADGATSPPGANRAASPRAAAAAARAGSPPAAATARAASPPAATALAEAATAASRRTRALHALGWCAPVVLLAALGLADELSSAPAFGQIEVPDPLLGPLSPWLTAVLCVLPLLARARAPVAATLAVFALVIARMLTHDLSALTFSQFYVIAAAAFLGVAHTRHATTGIALTLAAVATSLACMALEQIPYGAFAYSFAALLPASAGVAGMLVRDRVATAARSRRAHERADRAQEELARERVLAERLKAARELHDVVGHAVTVISLQAAVAARYANLDLQAARKAAATVLEVAGDAERELAALGQLLESEPPPVATLEDVISRVREAGLPVTLVERLDDEELALPLALTVVRVVQEALTNVGRHAGHARTTVSLHVERRRLVVEVINARGAERQDTGSGSGRGVTGMRERVALYGGTLEAGPAADGGWRVRAELPLNEFPADDQSTQS